MSLLVGKFCAMKRSLDFWLQLEVEVSLSRLEHVCKGICLEVASCICAYPDFRLKAMLFFTDKCNFWKSTRR